MMTSKTCPTCKTEKPLSGYHIDNRKANGRQSRCKECQRAAVKASQGTHYYEANAGVFKVRHAARRATEYGVESTLTIADWVGILRRQQGNCAMCREAVADCIDHIQPMSLGGGNVARNVQALCFPCERRKTGYDVRLIAAIKRQRKAVA